MKQLLVVALGSLFLHGCSASPPPQPAAPEPAAPAATPALPPPASNKPIAAVPKPDPDAELAASVKKALGEEIAQGVDITAQNGAVRLYGTVPNAAARRSAQKAAASVPGVTSVDTSKLVVVKGS
jgi:hypothetical protein